MPTFRGGKFWRLVNFGLAVFIALTVVSLARQRRFREVPLAMKPIPSSPGTPARLARHVVRLAGEIGDRSYMNHAAQRAAGDYIAQQFRLAGYQPLQQAYQARGPQGSPQLKNIWVSRRGEGAEAPVLVLGAHYDTTYGTPGADDNASGVAALLELARRFQGKPGAAELRFVAFDSEEPPFFGTEQMGSWHFARQLKNEKRKVLGMIALEMLGCYRSEKGTQKYPPLLGLVYPSRGNYIGAVADWRSRRLLRTLKAGYLAPRGTPLVAAALPRLVGVISLSDQLSFWKHGFPALMVTDTAFLRNPHYHLPGDTPATLDYETMADVVDGLEASLDKMTR